MVRGGRSAGWIGAVVGLALILRLGVVIACRDAPLFSDTEDYHQRAVYLLAEGRLWPDAYRPPVYPMFVAGVYALAGPHPLAVRVVQAFLGAATVWLTYGLARALLRPGPALVAALAVAVYPAWLLYTTVLMAETLFALLVLLGVWLWLRRDPWAALAAGAAIGAAALTRAPGLVALGALVVVTAWEIRGRRGAAGLGVPVILALAGRPALLVLGAALVMSPWVARNYQLYGVLVLPDSASGQNVLFGNHPLATGTLEHEKMGLVAARYWQHARHDVDRGRIGYQEGLRFVRAHPGRAAVLALHKVAHLFGLEGRELAWAYSHGVFGRRASAVAWGWGLAILVGYPLLMATALPALVSRALLAHPLGRAMLTTLILVAAAHVVSFGESRFHLPWVPFLAIAAACTVAWDALRPGDPHQTGWHEPGRRAALGLLVAGCLLAWGTQVADLVGRLIAVGAMGPTLAPIPY